jgi:aquaporin Z
VFGGCGSAVLAAAFPGVGIGLLGVSLAFGLVASGKEGFDASDGFAANGYGAHSPGGYSLLAALVTEIVMTMVFVAVILGATDSRAPQGFAPIAIGLCLTLTRCTRSTR